MKVTTTPLPGVLVLEPRVFRDERGFFMESWNRRTFREATGVDAEFVQDNHSRSTRGVLRGLHYQREPHAQGKLVRVLQGEIFDVAVDLRRSSATCGKWFGLTMTAERQQQLWIPAGFAHGFLVLSQTAEVLYKATDYYAPEAEASLLWSDPEIGIEWPVAVGVEVQLSPKDAAAKRLVDPTGVE